MISPQCGSDGRTYSNTCMLNCAKQRYCWSLKMIQLSKIWRCAEMTRGLTARAGPCSTNPLLNAVKQAGKKSIILFKRNLLGQVNFSEKKLSKWQSTEPWRPVDPRWEVGREVLQLPLYSDQGSPGGTWPLLLLWGSLILGQGSKTPSSVEPCLFRFSGDHWFLLQDQRLLGGSLLTLNLLLSVWFRRTNISKQMSSQLRENEMSREDLWCDCKGWRMWQVGPKARCF